MASNSSWDFYRRTLHRMTPGAEHQQYFYFRQVRNQIRPGIIWLDAGCGHSLVPEWMKGGRELEEWFVSTAHEVVGCDADLSALTAHSSKIRRVACDLGQLCFRQDTFDLVTCNVVVEHLERPGKTFLEFFRALRPGGTLVIHTPNLLDWGTMISRLTPYWFHKWAVKLLDGRESHDVFPTRYRANTKRTLRWHLAAAGFRDPMIHLVPGSPRLVGFGPALYLECLLHRAIRVFPQAAQFLCAVAQKPLDAKAA